ncbi:MAG: OB-fold nucleic acid binding domain-containing protein, partial [Actinobacteria bacterium]|nr:OB-fold nucleic acid binding domain-containing protein [Actinomycetota bacterium]
MTGKPSLVRRLTGRVSELDAADLQQDAARLRCDTVDCLQRGQLATVAGRLRSVVYNPRETVPTVDAELFDGTSSIELVWLGRRRIAGLEPGRRILVRGRVGVHDGRLA